MISKEDLATLKSKNYQLIFNIGVPYSGKKTQCEKVSNKFKFSKIYMKKIIEKEIESNSNLGQEAKKYIDNNEPIKTEVLVSILINKIIESHELSIMIEGFPNTLEEALYFEQNIIPITKIINNNSTEDECFHCLEESKASEKLSKEEFSKKYNDILKNVTEINNFYTHFSVIHNIDASKTIAKVNSELKRHLYPKIYSIIGKRYSGKTELSKELKNKIGMVTLLNFDDFLKETEI